MTRRAGLAREQRTNVLPAANLLSEDCDWLPQHFRQLHPHRMVSHLFAPFKPIAVELSVRPKLLEMHGTRGCSQCVHVAPGMCPCCEENLVEANEEGHHHAVCVGLTSRILLSEESLDTL